MSRLFLIIPVLFIFAACTNENKEFRFDLKDKNRLKAQLEQFNKDLSMHTLTEKYCEENVQWREVYAWYQDTSQVAPSVISERIISKLRGINLDSLKVEGNTITGLENTEGLEDKNGSYSWVGVRLQISPTGKIEHILTKQLVTIGGFYMDEDEITSNEYRQFTDVQLEDSVKVQQKDSVKIRQK